MEVKLAGSVRRKELPRYILLVILFALIPIIPAFVVPSAVSAVVVRVIGTVVFAIVVAISLKSLISVIYGSRNTRPMTRIKHYPTVSIVVPSYNEEAVLERTIRSVQELDYPREKIEMIYVYESDCTDRTEEIILRFAKEDPRIKPVKRIGRKTGKAGAANYGIERATGEIIVSMDADHSLKADALKRAVVWFQNPDVVCVKGRCRSINKGESFMAKMAGVERDVVERLSIYSSYKMHGFSFFGGGQVFLRRCVFDMLGKFSEELQTEDVDFSVKLHLAGKNIIVDPRIESWEENPATVIGWWHQRKRWSRGWIQVARYSMGDVVRSKKISFFKKMDMIGTLLTTMLSFVTPIMIPLIFISLLRFSTSFFPENLGFVFWILAMATPFTIGLVAWCLDIREGEKPRWSEIPYMILLMPYFVFHGLVSWAGFADEFILRKKSEYVKTVRNAA